MKRPFHPFLFSAYFVLALLGLNIDQVKPSATYRSLVIAFLAAGLFWLLLHFLVRDWGQAAVITSLYSLLFFTYGHVYHMLKPNFIFGIAVGRHRILIPIWLLIAGLGTFLVLRKVRNYSTMHAFLNVLGIVALAFPLVQITVHTVYAANRMQAAAQSMPLSDGLHLPIGQTLPDIYFIILDGYTRQDVLQKLIGFDNSVFLAGLRRMGFYIADCSQSNYSQTSLSMASALNFNYVHALGSEFHSPNTDTLSVIQFLAHSAARQDLKNMGYSLVTFETSYYWLRIEDADFYFSPRQSAIPQGKTLLPEKAFEAMLLHHSARSSSLTRLLCYPEQWWSIWIIPIKNIASWSYIHWLSWVKFR